MLDAYKEEKAERLVLLGDLLYHGPRNDLPREYAPKQVISMLNDMKKEIYAVRGNCEAEVDQMVLHFFHTDLHNPLVFLVGQVGELAIAAAGSQGAVFKILNLINQPADILAIPLIVNIAIFLERRDCHVAHAAFFQMPL